jgi:hypothetical protein
MASPSFSRWSVASVVFLALAILSAAGTAYFATLSVTGPADGAVVAFLVGTGAAITWLCALLGALCGTVGVRRTGGYPRLAGTALALNTLICMLPLLWWLLLVLSKGGSY